MLKILIGLFFILHGLVHLLYFGQSRKLFELQPGMTWPEDSWLLSGFLENETIRLVAGFFCILAVLGFAGGGVALFAGMSIWCPIIISSSAFSTLLYLGLWDGKLVKLPEKGAVAIVINLLILLSVLFFG